MGHEEKIKIEEEEFVTNEKAKKALRDGFDVAKDTLDDEDKLERLFQRLEKKLESIPLAGSALKYIPMMASMVNMYVKKEYTDAPVGNIVATVSALIYVASPIDIVPDFIPGFGYIDDAAVVAACLALIKTDLDEYKSWRKINGYEIDDLYDYSDNSKNAEFFAKIMSMAKKS